MSTGICSCETPAFGNMARPNCVIEQGTLSFPIIVPRYKADGSRNTLDLAVDPLTLLNPAGVAGDYATMGAYIKDRIENSAWSAQERFYPLPKVKNATFERSETVYETSANGEKYKIAGVGGVRSKKMELWAKDAVSQLYRELKKFGCSELDEFDVDVNGAIWGIKDDASNSVIRGYEMSSETWDVFKDYATDTTVNKLMISFDLENSECEENSYAITAEELGYKATSLKGLISGYASADNTDLSTVVVDVTTRYGSASTYQPIVGLLSANFLVVDTLAGPVAVTTVTENPNGTYTLAMTAPLTVTDTYTVIVLDTPTYDIASSSFVA
jgi:hypothetical protein